MSKESQAVILNSNLPALLRLADVASSILLSCIMEGTDVPQEIADALALIGSEIQRKVRMYNENPFALLNEELAVTYVWDEEGFSCDKESKQ